MNRLTLAADARASCLAVACVLFAGSLRADCGAVPNDFVAWSADEPVPVESIPAAHWYRDDAGWIVAPDRCQAIEAARERHAAVQAFRRHFGRLPGPGAVVDLLYAAYGGELKAAGAGWVLPWRFSAAESSNLATAQIDAIRRQVEAQLGAGGGMPDQGRVDALVQQAMAALNNSGPQRPAESSLKLESTAIRHEVAHVLFMHEVWPSTRPMGSQYGGDAPDWLDEAAAIAAESAAMTEGRRRDFRRAVVEGRLLPLTEFFAMPHPVYADPAFGGLVERARRSANQDGTAVLAISVDEDAAAGAVRFYAQTRALLDYLEARAGVPAPLGRIADSLRSGISLERWLAESGAALGLPEQLEALDADFRHWAESEMAAAEPVPAESMSRNAAMRRWSSGG